MRKKNRGAHEAAMKLDAASAYALQCRMRNRFPLIAFLLLLFTASPALAQNFTELPRAFQVRGYPGQGDFQFITAAALDRTDNTVTLLAGPPAGLFTFDADTGAALKFTPLEKAPEPPAVMWRCGGPTVILTHAGFLAIGPDGLPVKDFTPPEHIPDALSRAVCSPSGELVFFDSANARIHAIARNQELKFVIGGQTGDKPLPRDAALLAPADGALDAVGELYVLEGKTGAVKRYSHRGEFRRVVVRRNSMDASVRLSRPALLAVDLQTRIWLFDQGDMSLKVYDDFGYLKYFITNTDRDGFLFQEPQWMSVSRDNRLLLLDAAVPVLRAFDLNALP